MELVEEEAFRFRIPQRGKMRVPGIVYASRELIPDLAGDRSLEQVAHVATLPGIVTASYAMPDVHLGYGFPIGGVAATDPADGGVVSPGGVGFDISCGVRLLAAGVGRAEVMPVLGVLMDRLAAAVPRGAGRGGIWHLSGPGQMRDVLTGGARYALGQGYGAASDPAVRWRSTARWHPALLTSAKLPTTPRTASARQSSRVGPHATMRRSAVCGTLLCPQPRRPGFSAGGLTRETSPFTCAPEPETRPAGPGAWR